MTCIIFFSKPICIYLQCHYIWCKCSVDCNLVMPVHLVVDKKISPYFTLASFLFNNLIAYIFYGFPFPYLRGTRGTSHSNLVFAIIHMFYNSLVVPLVKCESLLICLFNLLVLQRWTKFQVTDLINLHFHVIYFLGLGNLEDCQLFFRSWKCMFNYCVFLAIGCHVFFAPC